MRKKIALPSFLIIVIAITLGLTLTTEPNRLLDVYDSPSIKGLSEASIDPDKILAPEESRPKNKAGEAKISYRSSPELERIVEMVEFPTGNPIEVVYQRYEIEPLPIEATKHLVDMYGALVSAASNGNGDAAHFLYANTKICSAAARTEVERDKRVRILLNEQHAYVNSSDGADGPTEIIDVEPNEYELYRQRIYGRFEYCKGLSDEQISNPSKWLSLAVELGNPDAISRMAVSNYGTQDSFNQFKQLWDDGYVDNGHAIGIYYQQGVPTENGRKTPDYISAYAYTVAMNAVWKQAIIRSNPSDLANKIAAIDISSQAAAGYLSPSEQKIADELAIRLIRDHPKCCLSNW